MQQRIRSAGFLLAPSDPAFAPGGARRSVGLAANLTLRIASASIRCRYGPGTSPASVLTHARGRRVSVKLHRLAASFIFD